MNRKVVRTVICILLALIFVISLVAVIVPTSAGAVSQSEIDALQAQKDQLRAQQAQQQENIDALREQKADVLDQKAALDAENELARQQIAVVQEQIDLYNGLIEEKEAELEQAKAEEEEQAIRFRARVRELEENGKMSYIAILLEAKSVADLLSRMDMIGEIIAYDKQVEDDLIAAREAVEAAKQALEDTLAEQESKKAELEAEKAALEAKVAEAENLIKSLEADIDAYIAAYNRSEQQKKDVQNQIDAMVAELVAQEQAAKQAAQANNQTYDAGAAVGASGSMMWPCPSCHTITSQFGWRVHPITGTEKYHSGVDIGASYGAAIVAADGGTVITAGWVSGYGNCVVINHGNGLTTLYGHMSSIAVSAGQSVSKGQTIGYVGSTGNSTGPHLHWEVTVNGSRVNPLNYAT